MKDTVIFDLDGTLLNTLQDLSESVRFVQKQKGCPLHTNEQVKSHVGNGMRRLMGLSFPEGISEEELNSLFIQFKAYYEEHCNEATAPYDGIMDMLKILKEQGYKLAIVSNKGDFAVKELNRIYFSDYVQVAIGEQEEKGIRRKPAPDTVLEALLQLGSEVENAVYVGDSEVDILTAKNSKMDLISCEWGFRDRAVLEKEGAKIFAKKPDEIPAILKKMNQKD